MGTRLLKRFDKVIITSRFGMRVHPVDKVTKMHNGIDLVGTDDGSTGYVDDIKCHTSGTVVGVGCDPSAGNFLNVLVADGSIMAYYHMKEKCTLKVGDTVKEGDIIGRMGASGKASGSHLHFGIKKDGKWIDPEPYINADYLPANDSKFELPKNVCGCMLPILRRGDKGVAVKNMQNMLIAKGYKFVGSDGTDYGADGSFGGTTERIVKQYRQDNKLSIIGETDFEFWQSIICK